MKAKISLPRGNTVESMLRLTPMSYVHTPMSDILKNPADIVSSLKKRLGMEFSNRRCAYGMKNHGVTWKSVVFPGDIAKAASKNYFELNQCLAKADKLASMKIVQASRKQLEPLMKEKQNFESHYEVRDISAKLHYLYTAEVETHTLGQMMARIQATQTAYSLRKSDGKIVMGSREPQKLDEYVYFYFYAPTDSSKSVEDIWKVFAKRTPN